MEGEREEGREGGKSYLDGLVREFLEIVAVGEPGLFLAHQLRVELKGALDEVGLGEGGGEGWKGGREGGREGGKGCVCAFRDSSRMV